MTDTANSLQDLGAMTGDEAVTVTETLAQPKIDAQGRAYGTGRRKEAVARVWIKPGSGKITINGRDQEQYFARPVLRMVIAQPLIEAGRETEFDVIATVKGSGSWVRPVLCATAFRAPSSLTSRACAKF